MRVGRLEFVDRTLQKIGVLKAVSELTLGSGTNILASNSTDGATATSIPFSEGSNANGRWRRIGTLQECWGTVTLTFTSTAVLATTWTFPVPFKAATTPRVWPALEDNLASATPSIQQISSIYSAQASITNETAPVALTRLTGQTNFASGNTAIAVVYAFGEAP